MVTSSCGGVEELAGTVVVGGDGGSVVELELTVDNPSETGPTDPSLLLLLPFVIITATAITTATTVLNGNKITVHHSLSNYVFMHRPANQRVSQTRRILLLF